MKPKSAQKSALAPRLAAAAVIVLLAVAAEFLFVYLANRPVDAALHGGDPAAAARSYPDERFSAWEFEKTGAHDYYALAYNSYFYLDSVEGIWAQTLTVRLSRSAEDSTETVVYYDAVVDGTRGEYMAALSSAGAGVYTARLNVEALYSLRIYPTEQVRSTVVFSGVTINQFIVRERFSAARLLVWAFAGSSLYALALLLSAKRRKAAKKPSAWGYVYLFAQTLILLAAFQAPRLFSAASGHETLLLLGGFAGFSLLYGAAWLAVRRLKTPHAKLAACVLVCGALFCAASAPMQVPDEYDHYLRAYAVACGDFTFDASFAYPDDVQRLVSLFPGWFYKEVQQKDKATVLGQLDTYLNQAGEPFAGEPRSTPIQLIHPYLAPAVGVLAGRVLGNALVGFYLGRFANVCLLALCACFGLKWAKRYRGAVIVTALFPLTLFMGASYSYDACLCALLLLYLGLVFSERIDRRMLIALALCFGGITAIKPLYLPLALLMFTVPQDAFHLDKRFGRFARLFGFGLLLVCGAALYAGTLGYAALFMRGIQPAENPEGVDVLAQIHYVLSNPVRYALTAAVDGYLNGFYLDEMGLFGWLDVPAVLTGLLAPVAVTTISAFYSDEAPARPKADRWIFAGTAAVIYAVVVTGFYCTWSTLGSTSILGVQARYFIPALPCLCAVLSALFGGRLRFAERPRGSAFGRDELSVYLCASLGLLAAFETGLLYFFT